MSERAGPFEPLVSSYQMQGVPLPHMGSLAPEDMQQPYRQLLVHAGAMTPTLEDFFGQRLTLQVLAFTEEGTTLRRQVVLAGARDKRPVELGAIRIDLACFEAPLRELLRQGHTPMGTLLREFNVSYICRPAMFFRVEADALMRRALDLRGGAQPLFGRCNRILTPDGRVMADVVEVLAPVRDAQQVRAVHAG